MGLLSRRKLRGWHKCSRYFQEQRTRLHIMWRCSVILIRLKLEGVSLEDCQRGGEIKMEIIKIKFEDVMLLLKV